MIDFDQLYQKECCYKIQQQDLKPLHNYFLKKMGWIYIAKTKSHHFLKIGRTSKNPIERAKSLSSTGVLHDYEIIFSLQVMNQYWAEQKAHLLLKPFRISKEFFSTEIETAQLAFQKVILSEEQLLNRFIDVKIIKEDLSLIEYALNKKNL